MRIVDEAILTRLGALDGFDMQDGELVLNDEDNNPKIVRYDLPYAVYASNIGDDDRPRLTGRRARRSVFFSILYVGNDRNQTKACGERIRDSLQDKVIPIPGHKTWLCRLEESQRVRRDDEAVRPDGSPLYYGVDNYALPITLVHTA